MNVLQEIIVAADRINVDRARYASHITYQHWLETERGIDYLSYIVAYRNYVNLDNVVHQHRMH